MIFRKRHIVAILITSASAACALKWGYMVLFYISIIFLLATIVNVLIQWHRDIRRKEKDDIQSKRMYMLHILHDTLISDSEKEDFNTIEAFRSVILSNESIVEKVKECNRYIHENQRLLLSVLPEYRKMYMDIYEFSKEPGAWAKMGNINKSLLQYDTDFQPSEQLLRFEIFNRDIYPYSNSGEYDDEPYDDFSDIDLNELQQLQEENNYSSCFYSLAESRKVYQYDWIHFVDGRETFLLDEAAFWKAIAQLRNPNSATEDVFSDIDMEKLKEYQDQWNESECSFDQHLERFVYDDDWIYKIEHSDFQLNDEAAFWKAIARIRFS